MSAQFGLYVHVPFCRSVCDYCAFSTYSDRDALMGDYVDACIKEIELAGSEAELEPSSSVFFGGGTPSRLAHSDLVRLLEAIPRHPNCEVTVECNPEDVTPALMDGYRRGGVTRISLGAQSTVPRVLVDLGRHHSVASVKRAAKVIGGAGFDSWSVDLILGARAETDADWDKSLFDVLDLDQPPRHVSAYSLTIEPGTPLALDSSRHPDDDVQARRYERTDKVLSDAGYRWEEISNWARPGHGCRHNQLYWTQGDYRGIGSAAHSHENGRRWWNVRTPERYISYLSDGRPPMAGSEVLTPSQRHFESLLLSLRTPRGVPDVCLPHTRELDGLVERSQGRAVLTLRGRLLVNAVTLSLEVEPLLAGSLPR